MAQPFGASRSAPLVVAVLLGACGQKSTPPRELARDTGAAGAAPTADTPPPLSADEARDQRTEWLEAVRAYVANPSTIPRLRDPDGRDRFQRLVSEPAWLAVDGALFEREGPVLLEFFPAAKALSIALVELRAVDESVLFKLYMDEVNRSMIRGGIELMEAHRKTEPNQEGREEGLARMQIGLAMNLCALLFEAPSASAPIADMVTKRLLDPNTYASHSAASLQLVLATIDERLDAKRLRAVRAVIEEAYQQRLATERPPSRIYEGLVMWSSLDEQRVVSRGGGFAVTVGNGALVWHDLPRAKQVEHLEWRDGELLFEIYCLAGVEAEAVVASFVAAGAIERAGPGPGHWLTQQAAGSGKDAAMRVLPIGARTCAAGVEAPTGSATPARFDQLLGSLAPAP